MATSLTSRQPALPPKKQQLAILNLLTDEDPKIYRLIRGKLLSFGPAAARNLLHPHLLSPDPVMRRRCREILETLNRREADNRFLTHCLTHKDRLEMETAVWMLARTRYPDINVEAYEALVDCYVMDLFEWIDCSSSETEILDTINVYLFHNLAYQGDEDDYYNPDNSYLNRVIDRRTGNPISLCILYMMVTQRLHLPITGIGLPGHFLCRYQSSTTEVFVDPFNRGRLLSRRDCINMLKQSGIQYSAKVLHPASPNQMIRRICANLYHIHQQKGDREEAKRFHQYLVAM